MANLIDSKAFEPTGQIEELRELELDPAVYRSCSMPEEGKNAGCSFFPICEQPYKGVYRVNEDGSQFGGPHHHGILYISASGASVQDVRSCFQFAQMAPEHQQSGEVYEIVADEGEEILIKGTKAVPVNAANPGGRHKAQPFQKFEKVPVFARPSEVFHDKVYELKVRKSIELREKNKRFARATGFDMAARDLMSQQNEVAMQHQKEQDAKTKAAAKGIKEDK